MIKDDAEKEDYKEEELSKKDHCFKDYFRATSPLTMQEKWYVMISMMMRMITIVFLLSQSIPRIRSPMKIYLISQVVCPIWGKKILAKSMKMFFSALDSLSPIEKVAA